MKQTAVDFLIMQIELKADSIPCNTQLNRSVKGAYVDCLVMLKQTKEMEKQQIINAYDLGSLSDMQYPDPKTVIENGEHYYNVNYKQTEK